MFFRSFAFSLPGRCDPDQQAIPESELKAETPPPAVGPEEAEETISWGTPHALRPAPVVAGIGVDSGNRRLVRRFLFQGFDCGGGSEGGVFQRGNNLGMAIPPDLRHFLNPAEFQAVGGTGGDTGWLKSFIQPILAIIAFDHFSDFRMPLGRAPRAGGDAGLAAHAQAVIHKHNAVIVALLHGAGGTGRHTPRGLTMKTRHKNIGRSRKSGNRQGADLDDLTEPGTGGKILVRLALNFAGMTANTFFRVLKQIVFAHPFFHPSWVSEKQVPGMGVMALPWNQSKKYADRW